MADLDTKPAEGAAADAESAVERDPELAKKKELFNAVVSSFGYREAANASREERRERGWNDSSLVYGEIEFPTFAAILKEVRRFGEIEHRGVFTDLGSGTGKAILDSLHNTAQRFLGLWKERVVPELHANTVPEIELVQGNALDEDLTETSLLYMGATCFDDELFGKFAERAKAMRPGTYAVTLSIPLPETDWERLVTDAPFTMSWGGVSVFIHRRRQLGDGGKEKAAPTTGADPAPATEPAPAPAPAEGEGGAGEEEEEEESELPNTQ